MDAKFVPSINIIRDKGKIFRYLPTQNARKVFEQLAGDYDTGIRSFNIIGSYGTGKSAFLWAFERALTQKDEYFGKLNGHFGGCKKYEFRTIVGSFESIITAFAKVFNLSLRNITAKDIFAAIDEHATKHRQTGIIIAIDEMGKFLEFAARNDSREDLFFIQQLAEHCNDVSKNILLLGTLHQGFDSYSFGLSLGQRQEWAKIKGRLKEIPFNEPVEQLLLLAADFLSASFNQNEVGRNRLKAIEAAMQKAKLFSMSQDALFHRSKQLLPLDLASAAVLTLGLQRYGQNERSLFTFLQSKDPSGLQSFIEHPGDLFHLGCVFDYLMTSHYSLISSRDNPHYIHWIGIQNGIERAQAISEHPLESENLVKTIGLLNIFASQGGRIDDQFLIEYSIHALGIAKPRTILQDLERKQIIRFVKFKNRYVLFEGTDFDIETAVNNAAGKLEHTIDVVSQLKRHISLPSIPAKAVHYTTGFPRSFGFTFSETPLPSYNMEYVDGVINIVINGKLTVKAVQDYSKTIDEPILFCFLQDAEAVRKHLNEIRKLEYVLESIVDDKIARREIASLLAHEKASLNQEITNGILTPGNATWVSGGKTVVVESRKELNAQLSKICERIYFGTPVHWNELTNRYKLSSAIAGAKRDFFEGMLTHSDAKDFGFMEDKFPPEKTIYRSLVEKPKIHQQVDGEWRLSKPKDPTYATLWNACDQFMEEAKSTRKSVLSLFELLRAKPFGLRDGFLEFWIPLYLFIRREDFALFNERSFVPNLNMDVIELVLKTPRLFFVKTYEIDGVRTDILNRFASMMNRKRVERISHTSFVDIIKPLLALYRTLPTYVKFTKRLRPQTIAFREAIAVAKDPEKTFFEDIPASFGTSVSELGKSEKTVEKFYSDIQRAIKELRVCYEELLDRMEAVLLKDLGLEDLVFPDYQEKINLRYAGVKSHLLLNQQLVFCKRLTSGIDTRSAWLSSICQAVVGKPIEELKDEEEEVLYSKMGDLVRELDGLTEITSISTGTNDSERIRFELITLGAGKQGSLLSIPKSKEKEVKFLIAKLKGQLPKDKAVAMAAMAKLIGEMIDGK